MKEKIYILIIGIMIGVVLGYGWRMIQVEPHFDDEIKTISQNQKRITKDIYNIELRLTVLEENMRGLNIKMRKREKP